MFCLLNYSSTCPPISSVSIGIPVFQLWFFGFPRCSSAAPVLYFPHPQPTDFGYLEFQLTALPILSHPSPASHSQCTLLHSTGAIPNPTFWLRNCELQFPFQIHIQGFGFPVGSCSWLGFQAGLRPCCITALRPIIALILASATLPRLQLLRPVSK